MNRILQREHEVFGHLKYTRLAEISVSHLYNLRRLKAYRKVRVRVEHSRASQVSIGERRKPERLGKPGYFRVDTVHQGHQDGRPGLFHLNAVDMPRDSIPQIRRAPTNWVNLGRLTISHP